MAEFHDLTISVRVYDRAALLAAAMKHAQEVDGLSEADAAELLKDTDEDGDGVNVSACLQMIFDPGVSPDGCDIQESRAEWVTADDDEEDEEEAA